MGHKEGSGENVEQVAQKSCECPITGSVQGQVGWAFEQPGPVKYISRPAPWSGAGL